MVLDMSSNQTIVTHSDEMKHCTGTPIYLLFLTDLCAVCVHLQRVQNASPFSNQ